MKDVIKFFFNGFDLIFTLPFLGASLPSSRKRECRKWKALCRCPSPRARLPNRAELSLSLSCSFCTLSFVLLSNAHSIRNHVMYQPSSVLVQRPASTLRLKHPCSFKRILLILLAPVRNTSEIRNGAVGDYYTVPSVGTIGKALLESPPCSVS